tara:strand:+ start:730 stop:1218 length:489 start_codon:yes stop_codon:yes gene_type:complete
MNIFLSLGSNMGDRLVYLKKALLLLSNHIEIEIMSKSKIYETSPIKNKKQNYFLNQVIRIKTLVNPLELLNITQKIENQMGRTKNKNRYQARIIDIDILTFNDIVLNQKKLVIPHAQIKLRKFVLKPWTDIASNYILPNSKKTIKELLDSISHFNDEVREYN